MSFFSAAAGSQSKKAFSSSLKGAAAEGAKPEG